MSASNESGSVDERPVVWFDIDNTLYSASSRISHAMGERIHDPLDFDRQCDGSLPLEDMIKYDPAQRKLFEDIDRSKVRVWGLTNAYRPHAERVLRILKLDDLIDGLVYCDYQVKNFSCKPEPEFYQDAMKKAKLSDPSKCYFIDDNRGNIDGARAQGWARCVHFCEQGLEAMEGGRTKQIDNERAPGAKVDDEVKIVTTLEELRGVWPEIFKA
ncbi:hypothetical protein DXG03_000331 [Asterophora parasitica]|uniref:Pyrimidine 5-nucleotidase n=1 Tax=Asterophora parasitica TaxID=117018 RepID=A0A9P7GL50_9AGAR|nr:hypothetical protein DXG03_000331 [Asterophora parasitica]